MPRNNFNKIDEEYYSTILDESFQFKGTIKFENSSIIKGYIEGKIESKGILVIGPKAVVTADISAKTLECFGQINGDVCIEEEAYFHAPAVINGSIKTKLLTFEKGCILNGNVIMKQKNDNTDNKKDKGNNIQDNK